MSSIQKLSIQGIRSFGPDDNNRGVVEFHSPLTLILGPNGTGKTTIIESLKYITTGDFPPGGSKDGAFIHDPKIAREAEIKGQIRLQFKDMQGNTQVVTRSVIAKQQAKKITVRTLEGTIAKHGKDGRTQTISNKCADLNQEMVSLLGVSKAVLENVIFCHQEDSNWPLSEGKVVKSKFDDIFASTRYVKALDKIIKLRKELAGEIKLLENDVGYLKVNKDKATKYASDLEELKCRYQASKESVTALDERLAPIGDKLEKIDSEEADLNELRTKIEKLKSERTEMQTSLKDLQANIENEYTGTTEELQTMLKDFQRKVDEREDSLHNIQRNLNKVERDLESANKLKTKQLLENGRLEQEAQHNLENIERRNGKIQRYAEKYDLTGFDDQIDDEQYRNFEMAMQEKAAVIEQKGKTKKMEYEEKESILQKEIEEQSSQKTKIETELKIKGDRLNTISLEMREINHQLSLVDASENILEDVKNDLERAMCKCRDAEGSVDSDALRREVKDLQKTKTTLEAEYKQLDAELQRMHLESKTRTQLEMLKRDKTAKEDTIRRLKNKNEDGLQEVFGEIPQSNLRKLIDNYIRKQGSSVQEATQSLQELRIKLSSKETERKTLMDHQHQKERELREHEEKIYTECESQNFDEGLESISNRIQINQEKYGLLTGSNHVFTNYKTKLGRQDPPCPLCKRPFDTIQEAEELSKELETKLSMLPEKSQKVKQDLEKFQSKYDRMQQLKPLRTSITTLKERELPGLKQKIKLCNETIEELRKDIETNEDKLECLQVDEASAKSIQPDMVRIDGFEMEIRELDRKIDAQSAKLNTGDSNRTTDSVSSEREEKQLQLESSNRDLEYKRDKLTSHTERVQQLKTEANDLLARKLQLDKDLQQRQKLEENKTQLQSEHEVLNCAIQEGQQLLQPKRDAIAQLTEDKEILTGKKERDLEIVREQISKIRDGYKDVKTIQRHITGYIEEGKEGLLKQNIEKTAELEAKAAKLDAERNGYQEEVAEIKDDLAKQQVRFRELNDNLSARRKENAIKQKSENIEELDKQLGGLDVNNLTRQRRQLKEDYAKIEKEKHVAEGRQRGHEDQMKSIKVELRSDAYHKAEEKYRDKVITLKTTQLVTTDLQKYYAALDGSINSYHKTKMSDINQIVAELWRNTYRGNDIDTIEIRSDDDVGNSASNRRTFNYRVVMMKGETAIDMRGRCSAGQKVLASLIIRLALAETFCLNCGIIALDEPTTNLDRRNIESLALSLVEIIKSRRSQSNFQLICITHDEEFVEQLGRAEFVEKFCRVGKDPFGCSRITGCNVSQLHQ